MKLDMQRCTILHLGNKVQTQHILMVPAELHVIADRMEHCE